LLQAKAVLDAEESKVHAQDLPERQMRLEGGAHFFSQRAE
jgi:hypothetical protein